MINGIEILALKSIDKLTVTCKNLNIITGTNSSGKSTFLQAILLYVQSYEKEYWHTKGNGLNGKFVSIGEFRENKNINSTSKEIVINMDSTGNHRKTVKYTENVDGECVVEYVKDGRDGGGYNVLDMLNNIPRIKYLSCNRIGANDVYSKDYSDNDIGTNGEYAIYYLQKNRTKNLDKKLIIDSTQETLESQVNYWLKYIVNTTIKTEDLIGTDIVKASFNVGNTRDTRPKNVGSGTSYLISILILCLSAKEHEVLIIENPEIHLHPTAQSKLCEFLYFIAESGRQIFIETHSDHMFNGVRVGVATGSMDKELVTVNFFELDDNNSTVNNVVEFGKRGRILNVREGLFDQFDNDLNRMLGLKNYE